MMTKANYIFKILIGAFLISTASCSSESTTDTVETQEKQETANDTISETQDQELEENTEKEWGPATERFIASSQKEIIFEHVDYQSFRLYEDGTLVGQGGLNTERGFENDPDATVFVLESEHDYKDQLRIVRFSNRDRILMYKGTSEQIEGIQFVMDK